MKRSIWLGSRIIETVDSVVPGDPFYEYTISEFPNQKCIPFATIKFQKGSIEEAGKNGCHNEDLLMIVLDRLQAFQEGELKCRENAIAITKIEEALLWLEKRKSQSAWC